MSRPASQGPLADDEEQVRRHPTEWEQWSQNEREYWTAEQKAADRYFDLLREFNAALPDALIPLFHTLDELEGEVLHARQMRLHAALRRVLPEEFYPVLDAVLELA